ncbi:glycosyl hydrolase family 28 protein [Verrucomicrobium spinosum]|uniref:glycosyl hydrolase family 28 protein n=1 Tax=Verrucomicrobium spinosum TaxID=2736 RepID=UPI0012F63249|nr:glycosyl hydrolase family 28 protein [Verrucomicrobium spinosum]
MKPPFSGLPVQTGWRAVFHLLALVVTAGVFFVAGGGSVAARDAGNRPPVINVWVNDKQVPVIEHWVGGRLNCTYAPLTLPGSAEVEVEVPGGVRHWTMSPEKCEVPTRMERGRLKFTLLTSHYMVVTVNGLRLLLLADPPEDELPEHQKVLDVTAPPYSLDRSGAKDGTDVLQKACDDAGALANEAVVMLPPGLYTTTGIRLRSRTQLYLAPGAVLQGRDDAESYPDYPSAPGKTASAALVKVDGVEHVCIFGRGTLDARGLALAGAAKHGEGKRLLASCVTMERSRCVTLEGVICKEATAVAVSATHCQDVAMRRVKVINDLSSEDRVDGIRLAGTQRALVEDCLVYTTEDAFSVTSPEDAVSEQVVLRRLMALTSARALRCGPLARSALHRVRFEDVDIIHCRDAMSVMHGEGQGEWGQIVFKDIRVENCGRNGIVIQLLDGGGVSGVRFENVGFKQSRPGFLQGLGAGHCIRGVTFAGLEVSGRPIATAEEAGLKVGGFVEDVRFDD